MKNNVRRKISILAVILIFILLVVSLALVVLSKIESQTREEAVSILRTVLQITHEASGNWIHERKNDVEYMASTPVLVSLTKKLLELPQQRDYILPSAVLADLRMFLKPVLAQHGDLGFFIISREFINIASTLDENIGYENILASANSKRVQLANIFRGAVQFFPPAHFDVSLPGESTRLTENILALFVAAPIKDENGDTIAALAILIDITRDFSRIAELGQVGETGETYFFDKEAKLMTQSRFKADLQAIGMVKPGEHSALSVEIRDPGGNMLEGYKPAVPRGEQPLTRMAKSAIKGESGFDTSGYRDYRGVPVLGAWLWDDDLNLGMATEIDVEDALTPYYSTRLITLVALIFTSTLALFIFVSTFLIQKRAEASLYASEEKIRLLLESAGEAIYGADFDNDCTFANPACLRILGYKDENELLGKNMHELMHHSREDGSPYPIEECAIYRAFRDGKKANVDKEVFWRADGTSFPVEYWSHPILRDGQIIGVVVTFVDITERKKADEALKQSSSRYMSLFESANDGIFIMDWKTADILDFNKSVTEYLGYSKDEIKQMEVSQLYTTDALKNNERIIEEIKEKGSAVFESQLKKKNGETLPVEISARIIDYGGQVVLQSFIRDITQRKLDENALNEYQDNLEKLVSERTAEVQKLTRAMDQSDEMVIITDTKGIVEYANSATEKTTGYSPEEIMGSNPKMLSSGKMPPEFFRNMWDMINAGKLWTGRLINKKKSGELYHEEMTISPVKDDKGVLTNFVSIKRDITKRIKEEEELKEAKEDAEKANTAKSIFLSSMSHELRTPLNSILGFSQLLFSDTDNPLTESQKKFIMRIINSGGHLLGLIDEVLDLSKIEAGKLSISLEDIELEPVMIEAVTIVTPLAQKRGIKINYEKPDESLYIKADLTRLRQVILNFLSNAVKYNREKGEVMLSCEYMDDETLRINIEDTGHGIAEEKICYLFEPFNRMGAETSDIEGSGIGMTITKKLVEAMNGRIGVESKVGKGTRFFVDFPKGKKLELDRAETTVIGHDLAGESVGADKTLLYIEDNSSNLMLVESILKRRPNITMIASTEAIPGIIMARENAPDVILMDINLPDIDGFEALKRLRSYDETRKIPVIAVTAKAMPEDIKKGKRAGFVDYVTKPINIGSFLKVIDNVLS